jgi:hypothetical protein
VSTKPGELQEYVLRKAEHLGGLRAKKPKRPEWLKRKDELKVIEARIAFLKEEIEFSEEIENAWDEWDRPRGLGLD